MFTVEELIGVYESPYLTLALAVFVALIIFSNLWRKRYVWLYNKRLPPGPFSFPIIGHIDFFKQPWYLYFNRLSRKYGKIFGLNIGTRYTVVATDYDIIKEMLNMDVFTNRPPGSVAFSEEYDNFAEMNGSDWKEQRRLFLKAFKALGMGNTAGETAIKNQINDFLIHLEDAVDKPYVELRDYILPAVKNLIFSMICSETFQDDPVASKIIFDYQKMTTLYDLTMFIYYPWKKFYYNYISPIKQEFEAQQNLFMNLIKDQVEKHQKSDGPNADYMDFYLEELKTGKTGPTLNIKNLIGNSHLINVAAGDTARTALEWCIMIMADKKDVQERLYKELVDLVGKERKPEWGDRNQLLFTQSYIMEVFRWKDVAPVNDPRWTEEDTSVQGYDIPKHTVVILNFYSVHRDKRIWDNPEEFNPERFLNPDGKSINSHLAERLMTFSMGKRGCPGERMANVQIFLFVTSLVQKFRLSLPFGGRPQPEILHFGPEFVNPLITIQKRE